MPAKKNEPSFVERPLPSRDEVRNFERQIRSEERSEDINGRLSEIYRDKRGNLIDVRKLEKRARRQVVVTIFRWFFGLCLLGSAIWAGLLVFPQAKNTGVELTINAPEKIKIGQEFSYLITYKNNSGSSINSIKLEASYPENFIFSGSDIAPASRDNYWTLTDLPAGAERTLEVKGSIINQENSANTIYAKLTYQQDNFSSDLKKEASAATLVESLGFRAELDYPSAALSGTENDLSLKIFNFEAPLVTKFRIDFEIPSSVTIIDPQISTSSSWTIKKIDNYWQVEGISASSSELEIPFSFKIKDASQDRLELIARFSYQDQSGTLFTFFEKRAGMDIIKNDLNLTMMVNGSQGDRSVNFGETLNYNVSYVNKGVSNLKNIAMSAVVDSPFVDWSTLSAESGGKLKDGVITWTKDEAPALAEIKPGQEGDFNFSVRLKKFSSADLGNNFQVKSYAQFNIDSNTSNSELNRSNLITSSLNSDLSFSEKILYFDDNNSPVGEGPLPPKSGEKTSFRVYWELDNTLHELDKVRVSLALPPNTSFEGRVKVQAGSVYYDQALNQVIWDLGRVPLSVSKITSDFSLSLIPAPSDRNKILVISPGAQVSAIDLDNNAEIKLNSTPKTTRLEDDEIAALSNSGKVQ
ncbi:MAG: hypothetical protein ACOYMB_02500 [Patescibacteria group bacterium]